MVPTRKALTIGLVLGLALVSVSVGATGGQKTPGATTSTSPELTPEQMAANSYNYGLDYIKSGDKLAEEARQEVDEKKRAKLEVKSRKAYERAIRSNQEAIGHFPGMYEAHSNLGYAYRKTGSYDESLSSYDAALDLEPRYTPAIEYRAEAYLALNRVEEAKSAYLVLFRADRTRADELGLAMRGWLEARRADPAGVAPEAIEAFSTWLSQRQEIAQQTSSLTMPGPDW